MAYSVMANIYMLGAKIQLGSHCKYGYALPDMSNWGTVSTPIRKNYNWGY
jgi:hypothetical protein